MAIQFAGLGSGLPINDWVTQLVDVKKATTLTPLENKKSNLQNSSSALGLIKTSFSSLQTALKAMQKSVLGTDVWSKASVTSSDNEYVSATSTSAARNTNTTIKLIQLATSTIAKSANSVGKLAEGSTKFSQIGNSTAKEGSFTFYVDNTKYSIDIGKDDTLDDIAQKINDTSAGAATGKVNSDGTFGISVGKNSTLSLGSSADTSNFKSVLQLTKYGSDETSNSIKSAYTPSLVKTSEKLTSEDSGFAVPITAGKIKINGQEFTIDENTTLNDLIRKINDNKDVKASATYDSLTNKLTLTSTETGEFNIALDQEGTNFLDAMGLMSGGTIAAGSQTVGKNAKALVNNNEVVSSSNTLTSSSTGISGLTITLNKMPTGDKADKEITLTSTTDRLPAKQATQTVIDAYNKLVGQIYEATASDGYLEMDSGLSQIAQAMRSMLGATYENDGNFNMLAKLGLTTYKTGDIETESRTIKIDSEKLNKAFDEDFESVRMLFTSDDKTTGLFDTMLAKVDSALDTENGYFKTKSDTITKQIKTADEGITRATKLLEAYQTQLTRQFNYMDKMISNLNSQYSAFTGT